MLRTILAKMSSVSKMVWMQGASILIVVVGVSGTNWLFHHRLPHWYTLGFLVVILVCSFRVTDQIMDRKMERCQRMLLGSKVASPVQQSKEPGSETT